MKPRFCEVPHNPPSSYGDCVRACIATMIDRDDVPHVFDDCNTRAAWAALRSYLAGHGKFLALFAIDHNHQDFMSMENEGIPYMLLGATEKNGDHAVVCRSGECIHNPGGDYLPIVKRHSQGFYVIGIIGDLIT